MSENAVSMSFDNYCFACRHWNLRPGELEEKHRQLLKQIALNHGIKEDDIRILGATFGKCRAVYRDQNGYVQVFDMGVLGLMNCTAKDDLGNFLFEKAPLG